MTVRESREKLNNFIINVEPGFFSENKQLKEKVYDDNPLQSSLYALREIKALEMEVKTVFKQKLIKFAVKLKCPISPNMEDYVEFTAERNEQLRAYRKKIGEILDSKINDEFPMVDLTEEFRKKLSAATRLSEMEVLDNQIQYIYLANLPKVFSSDLKALLSEVSPSWLQNQFKGKPEYVVKIDHLLQALVAKEKESTNPTEHLDVEQLVALREIVFANPQVQKGKHGKFLQDMLQKFKSPVSATVVDNKTQGPAVTKK